MKKNRDKKKGSVFWQELRRDLDTFQSLSGQKKIGFVWDYYKWTIAAVIFAALTAGVFLHMLWEGQKPCRLRVCVVLNTEDDCGPWFERFTEELTSDGKPGAVDVNLDQPFDYDNKYYYVQELEVMTTVSSMRMDVAVCGPDLYHYLLALNVCLPLDRDLSEDLYALLKDEGKLVYDTANLTIDKHGQTNPADGIDGYYAVDLTGTAFADRYNRQTDDNIEPLYAIIISNTEHLSDCEALLQALIQP